MLRRKAGTAPKAEATVTPSQAPVPKPETQDLQPAPAQTQQPPQGNGLLYAKCNFVGFKGVKDVVFVPDTIKWTKKSMEAFFQALQLEQPNLLLAVDGASCHDLKYILNEDELACPEVQALVEPSASTADRDAVIRDVLGKKFRGITSAVMAALDQTGSFPIFANEGNCFSQTVSELESTGSYKSKQLVIDHACNGKYCQGGGAHIAMTQMFAASVPFTEDSVETMNPVDVDLTWLREASVSVKSVREHLFVDESGSFLPSDQRHPFGQWWADGNVYLIGYTPNSAGSLDLTHPDAPNSRPCNFDLSLVAPLGYLFVGCRSRPASECVMNCFERGIPCLLVKHTGGVTSIWSELVLVIVQAIMDKGHWRKKFARDEASEHGDLNVIGRIKALSPAKVLDHALTASGASKSNFGLVNLADVVYTLDIAVARHQVFLDTVKVVDVLIHTPEQSLEILSGCFSSTYVGIQELGASSAQVDVVVSAWNMHHTLEMKAASLRRLDLVLSYLGTILAWVAILSASSLDVGRTCGPDFEKGAENPSRFCGVLGLEATQWALELMTIGVPAAGALIVTMAARFQFKTKWATTKLAAAQLVRHIYLFRGAVGPYGMAAQCEGDDFSQSVVAKNARMAFISKVSTLTDSVLSLDSVSFDSNSELFQDDIPQYIRTVVLGLKGDDRQRQSVAPPSGRRQSTAEDTSDPLLLEEGSRSSNKEIDDGVSATTAEAYYHFRVRQLLHLYNESVPQLSCQNDTLRLIVFVLGFVASMLGAMKISSWIPATVGFTSTLEALILCHNLTARTMVTNSAIASLRNLNILWSGLSNMDRRTPKFKGYIMISTEQLAVSVAEALVNKTSGTEMEQETGPGHDSGKGEHGSQEKKKKVDK